MKGKLKRKMPNNKENYPLFMAMPTLKMYALWIHSQFNKPYDLYLVHKLNIHIVI